MLVSWELVLWNVPYCHSEIGRFKVFLKVSLYFNALTHSVFLYTFNKRTIKELIVHFNPSDNFNLGTKKHVKNTEISLVKVLVLHFFFFLFSGIT